MNNSKLNLISKSKWVFRITVLILIIYYISINKSIPSMNYISNGILIIISSFIPDIICILFKFSLSKYTDFTIQLFIFLSLFLGKMYNFYSLIPWWDLFLHFLSGIILGFFSLTILKALAKDTIFKQLSPIFIFLFTFLFSVSIAALWEFWEFAGDQLFGFDSQLYSLIDTMTDMIIGSLGGLIVSIMNFLYVKLGAFKFLYRFLSYGKEEN